MRRRGRRALQPPGVTVHLCLTPWGERAAAGGCDRRVAGAGSLHRVPPHTDVLPSSLRERRDGKVALTRVGKRKFCLSKGASYSPPRRSPRTDPWAAWVPPPVCGRRLRGSRRGSPGCFPLRSTPADENAVIPSLVPPTHLRVFGLDLVQRAHGHFGDIVGDELPGGALGVAGGEALSVPQVPCRDQDGSVSF